MKSSCVITGIFLCLGIFIFSSGEVKGEEKALKTYEGLVIFLNDTTVEVKRGSGEVTFRLPGNLSPEKSPAAKDEEKLAICQRVRIWYELKKGQKHARKIMILRPGYCR